MDYRPPDLGNPLLRLVKLVGAGMLVLAVVSTICGVWWFLQSDKLLNEEWLREDRVWNAEQLERLEAIEMMQGTLEARQALIQAQLVDIIAEQQERFEELELEQGQRDVLINIATSADDLNYRVGEHWGWHQAVGR